jgi:putative ABC transport system permease protein
MIATRYRKTVRDLLQRPGRSCLAVLALAAGVFQIGVILYAYALLRPELTSMYGRTRPASATLTLDAIDDALVDRVRRLPGVAAAEARPVIVARARVGADEYVPAIACVVRDFDAQQLDLFTRDSGAWPPGPGDVLLERTALRVAGVHVGDSLTLRTADGAETRLRVAGTVHAPGLPPAWMEHMVPAFVGDDSRLRGPGADESAQLRIVAAHPLEEGFIRELADSVTRALERGGRAVSRVTVPTPGRHPHADQMQAFLFLLLAFGLLTFALSTVLVTSMVHGLLAEEVKQVGIMKTLGATSAQVAGVYLAQVGALAVAALALGMPLGIFVGDAYARFSAGILNTDVSQAPFPAGVLLAEIVVGVLLPLLVAVGPVRRAAGISVREALADDAVPLARPRRLDTWLARLAWLPRPLALSLRNTFARRARLALSVGLLAAGGAVFMAAMNVAEDWRRAVDDDFARRRYDLALSLSEPCALDRVQAVLAAVPGIANAESWPGASAWLVGANGVANVSTALVGPEPGTPLMNLRLLAGRGLSADDPRGAVVNQAVVTRVGGLAVGDSVRVRLRGRTLAFLVAGIARELAPMPVVYAPRAAVLDATGQTADSARLVRIVTLGHDDAAQRAVARDIERECERRGLLVGQIQRMQDTRQGLLDHLVIILSVLTTAALVVVFVGTLGLTTTLLLSVLQRTREFGVMSAIGATPGALARHVWYEGMLVGGLSWAAACVLTLPLSAALEAACGNIFFKVPLDVYVSPRVAGLWLLLVVVLASLGSLYPAWRAARLSVREALSHA